MVTAAPAGGDTLWRVNSGGRTGDTSRPSLGYLLADVQADSRERLLRVAMRLMASQGIATTTLKQISDAAGNRNKSAVGYHFNSKEGLVAAVLKRLRDDLAPAYRQTLDKLESTIREGGRLDCHYVVWCLLTPVFKLSFGTAYGPDALKILARIMHDPLDSVDADIRREGQDLRERAFGVLRHALPEKSPAWLDLTFQHALMATVNGLALQHAYVNRYRGRWDDDDVVHILLSYVDYVAGGLMGPAAIESVLTPEDIDRWAANIGLLQHP
jgi:AcrR family transcriptional regulator